MIYAKCMKCERCRYLEAAVLKLAEIVHEHLSTYEMAQDYIAHGSEPSDEVADIIRELTGGAP